VLLVVPIDSAAPKGRLILPQQQTIRDILDADARALVVKETQLSHALSECTPALVITDSQVFGKVAALVPETVPLTSFSILMARHKGFLETAVAGAAKLRDLKEGDRVLISEGCTHHRQCGDIGTEKLPKWLRGYCGQGLDFAFSSGGGFPEDLSGYACVIHCGGCMLTERQVLSRMEQAGRSGVPFTNYGTAIAQMNGILKRSLSLFPELVRKYLYE
jgi:[FeFe] hydrogenase H-cluster maturation GTPase HydF